MRGNRRHQALKHLEPIEWKGEHLVRVRKDNNRLHPKVLERTWEESEAIRMRHGIQVENLNGEDFWNIPNPIVSLDEAPFPDYVEVVMRQRGWTEPTPIQIQGWPVVLTGHDVIGVAATGSGKTMVYILPMLTHIIGQPELKPGEGPIGLILVPNRELCDQVSRETLAFSTCFPDLHVLTLKGGEDGRQQEEGLVQKADIIVATPGRLIQHLNNQRTNLRRATYVVFDEADMLLEQKFEDQTKLLLSQIRPDRQVLLFSATWEDNVEAYAKEVCKSYPIRICVGCGRLAACKNIVQVFACPGFTPAWRRDEPKAEAFCRAIQRMLQTRDYDLQRLQGGAKALVFCNTVEGVHQVVRILHDAGFPGEGFTRELSQPDRNALIERFHDPDPKELPVLVSTSALARGHDFRHVLYVINYDMPHRMTDYVHRIGRTGRAGVGFSLTFLEGFDLRFATELVDCLEETSHEIPPWLQRKATSAWKLYRKYWAKRRTARDAGGIHP